MNRMIEKCVSLVLVILITLLVLDYFKIIVFSKVIGECLSFITVVFIVFSSTAAICTSKSGLYKFINYIILLTITVGLIITIIYDKLNVIVYVSLLFTLIYGLMDMLFNKSS
ncbi:hypothetical protein [Clostridium sp. LP20]|uniref:hypothetical protein n=1 Tax=Clostridium sp. LP20 TaxID=3418665 RepID=UPI003EE7CE30